MAMEQAALQIRLQTKHLHVISEFISQIFDVEVTKREEDRVILDNFHWSFLLVEDDSESPNENEKNFADTVLNFKLKSEDEFNEIVAALRFQKYKLIKNGLAEDVDIIIDDDGEKFCLFYDPDGRPWRFCQ